MKSNKLIKNLSITFGVLILIFLIVEFAGGKKERNFKSEVVQVDTAKVTEFLLYPEANQHKEVKLFKDGNVWKVVVSGGKSVTVPYDKIKGLKQKLTELKIERLVSRSPKKWNKYKVDSTGTRVKVFAGSDLVADFIVGKFNMQGRRNFVSYVRNTDEDNVYLVNGFISPTFNRKADSFRNNYVMKADKNKWTELEFTYPADSSFTMTKDSTNNWFAGNTKLDSATVARYLSSVSRLYSSNFIDEFPSDFPKTPLMTLKIKGENGTEEIKCYEKDGKAIIESSYEKEFYFDGAKGKLKDRIFKGKNFFLKKENKKKKKSKKK